MSVLRPIFHIFAFVGFWVFLCLGCLRAAVFYAMDSQKYCDAEEGKSEPTYFGFVEDPFPPSELERLYAIIDDLDAQIKVRVDSRSPTVEEVAPTSICCEDPPPLGFESWSSYSYWYKNLQELKYDDPDFLPLPTEYSTP